jgi:phosphoribosylformylglycinamidine synthase
MQVSVLIGLKSGVLDPAGNTVAQALRLQGFEDVNHVRIGKWITLDIDAKTADEASARAQEMCESLLANQVIEDYQIEVVA